MALINIEYGSLASSETMNKNFMYLDDKLADTSESIMTSISSILSNIATINSRLNEISETTNDSLEALAAKVEDYKSKTKHLVNKATMLPDWTYCVSILETTTYTAPSNGYILLVPESAASGNLAINGQSVVFKFRNNSYDNSAQLISIPLSAEDVVSSEVGFLNAYFLPVKEVKIEEF